MATSAAAAQTYIQRLGFKDPDRRIPRHGLACEFMADLLIETSGRKWLERTAKDSLQDFLDCCRAPGITDEQKTYLQSVQENLPIDGFVSEVKSQLRRADVINVPVTSRGSYVNGFADVWFKNLPVARLEELPEVGGKCDWSFDLNQEYPNTYNKQILGEVKITPEPAENVIQQINFYREFIKADRVIIFIDYEDPQLLRLADGGDGDFRVYRLGEKFEEWIEARSEVQKEMQMPVL